MTDDPIGDNYAGVATSETVLTAIFIAIINGIQCIAADVGNKYLNSETQEKIYVKAVPEFGPLESKTLVVIKGLYELKTSAARWHEKLADTLRTLGYEPSKADPNVWMKYCGEWYQ